MRRKKSKTHDLSRGPGMTPIDNPTPDVSDEAPEPDRTTGRLPAQEDEDDSALKTTTPKKHKSATAGSRNE